MAMKRTTKLKKMIVKRTNYIEESTANLLDELSEVTGGADLFFKETIPNLDVQIEWSEIELTEKDFIIIKGVMVAEQFSAANVMVISVPIEMAAESTAEEICEYMIETSGYRERPESDSKPKPVPSPAKPRQQDFDLSELSPEQREALYLFNASRGGKV